MSVRIAAILMSGQSVKNFRSGLLGGLTNYFGGKRKLAKIIAKHSIGERFCDLFLGGGSVGMYLKAQGFQVTSCDRSYLSFILGRSLLMNNEKVLTQTDLQRLFAVSIPHKQFTTENYYPNLFTERHARWIDEAIFAANAVRDETTRCLLKMVIAKVIFSLRAFGSFTNLLYMKEYNEKREESILKRPASYYKNLSQTTWQLALKAMKEVNGSVFSNGRTNRFFPIDVFEFFSILGAWGEKDIPQTIYLDPPYYGSQNYEAYYAIVNKILTAGDWRCPDVSDFNSAERYFQTLERMIRSCERIPRLILSYGGYRGIEERDRILQMVRTHRGTAIQQVSVGHYNYSIHRTAGNGEDAPEFLIVSDL